MRKDIKLAEVRIRISIRELPGQKLDDSDLERVTDLVNPEEVAEFAIDSALPALPKGAQWIVKPF